MFDALKARVKQDSTFRLAQRKDDLLGDIMHKASDNVGLFYHTLYANKGLTKDMDEPAKMQAVEDFLKRVTN